MADDANEKKDDKGGLLGEAAKKVFTAGVTAAFMGEEQIRKYLGELKLPKDILATVLESANKSKEDITNRVSKEIVGIVQKIDFVKEFSKFAEDHKFVVTIDIEKKKN